MNEFQFIGGEVGEWEVFRQESVVGESVSRVSRLEIHAGPTTKEGAWKLRGFTSNTRYTTQAEQTELRRVQAALGRPEATIGSLIPIRKSPEWWALAQDERRAIFEESSHHIGASMRFLPAIARRLHHSRDLGEPFDFLTWFEFAPEHEAAFDELLGILRRTEEWNYVDRECEVRVRREAH